MPSPSALRAATSPMGRGWRFAPKAQAPPLGERTERCRWQKKRGERVAAVEKIEEKRKPEDFFGHRNRKVPQCAHWGG